MHFVYCSQTSLYKLGDKNCLCKFPLALPILMKNEKVGWFKYTRNSNL